MDTCFKISNTTYCQEKMIQNKIIEIYLKIRNEIKLKLFVETRDFYNGFFFLQDRKSK